MLTAMLLVTIRLLRAPASAFVPSQSSAFASARTIRYLSSLGSRSLSSTHLRASQTHKPQQQPLADLALEEENVKIQQSLAVNDIPRNFVPIPFAYHRLIIAKVESLTNLGIGICRVPLPPKADIDPHPNPDDIQHDNRRWVIMVPNVIPGELVKLSIYRNHKNYSDADLVEVIEPSPDRVEPKCELFDVCGGCQYQHMSISTQRSWKTRQVSDLYGRVAGLEEGVTYPAVLPALGTDDVYHYRSKITPHYDSPKKNRGIIDAIGFKQKASRRIVDVPYCHIATEAINTKLTEVREDKFSEAREGRLKRPSKGATLLLREANEGVITDNNAWVTTTVKDLTFRLKAGNFFQNNPYMLPVMDDLVVDAARQPNSKGEEMTHLIDCYCGSGLFCLGSAKHFDVCVGIEVNDLAVQEARGNAELNDIANCKFVSASAEAIFDSEDPVTLQHRDGEAETELVSDFPRDNTVVVVDPPRKGCSEEFLAQLYAFRPARVVYMSCDPATQARDAKGLVGAGYDISSIQPLDLFPQTRHIECLAIFERRQ